MTREPRVLRRVGCLCSAVLLVTTPASLLAQESGKTRKFLKKPLVIEDQGSFFIGGVPKVTTYATPAPNNPSEAPAPNQITIGQMYVQFQIPANRNLNMPPVIMVHGSTHTAACLESTPDGREGWAPYFVRQGISTYIVDQAGRGRSGFDESIIHEAAAMIRLGDVANGTSRIPGFGRITHSHGYADSARRSRRPAHRHEPRQRLLPRLPALGGSPHRLARRGHRRGSGRTQQLLRARVLQAVGAERRGHAARLHLCHLRPDRDLPRQYLDAGRSGGAGRA